jgi:phosphoribosylaminoimidazolecarboxamide formyltransferase / IMP cyclohydrolase
MPLLVLVVRRALLSVTDKAGIVDLAKGLARHGVEILSTGGTAKAIEAAGIKVRPLADFTGSPEMLDGRVKTLHPRVHGGILARRDLETHQAEMKAHGLEPIDLVAVNLYDFHGAVSRPNASFGEIVEEIDIGGPAMLRSAAKNHASVLPLVDPADYQMILGILDQKGDLDALARQKLAQKVYAHTARYDAAVAAWLERVNGGGDFPEVWNKSYVKVQSLRYGENPHQSAAFYRSVGQTTGLASAEILQGKELSYNNLLDLDAALGLAIDLGATQKGASVVYIKHNNPCGVATASDVPTAVKRARDADAVSAFGAVIAVNKKIDEAAARVLTEAFVEAIVAPDIDQAALDIFASKKNVRVLRLADPQAWSIPEVVPFDTRVVRGGALVQSHDGGPAFLDEVKKARLVTKRAPTDAEWAALGYAWSVAKHVRSNAIVFAAPDRTLAVGAGQMSRVDSVKICRLKAGEQLRGAAVASDAFFPFRDGVDQLAEAGATAIIQPGGSIRDEEVIAAADGHGVAMVFTGVRHFRH